MADCEEESKEATPLQPAGYCDGAPPAASKPQPAAVKRSAWGTVKNEGLTNAQQAMGKQMFQKIDTDGSGNIDQDELKEALVTLGIEATGAEVSFLVARADDDGSGELDYHEFLKIIAPSIKLRFQLMQHGGSDAQDDELNESVKTAMNEEFSRSLRLIREVEAIRQALDKHKNIILPGGRFMRTWDPVTMVALLFTAVVTPAEIAFAEPAYDALFLLNRIVDAIFLTDMVVQMFLAYSDASQNGRLVKDLSQIRRKYLRGWFSIDFGSVLPLDLVGMFSKSKSVQSVRVLRLMKLVRILKMARVLRANRIFQRWEYEISIPFAHISMAKFGVGIMFWSHWCACLWGMVAGIQDEGAYTWIDQLATNKLSHHSFEFRRGEAEFSKVEKYMVSLFWSVYVLTSIGLGDISPTNLGEIIMAALIMAFSSIFWAYTVGNFCSIISTMDMHTVTFRQRMDELNYMMDDLEIPKDVRRRCRAYFHNARRLKRIAYYHHLEQELSPALRRETKAHFYLPVLQVVWYFDLCCKEFLLDIATVLTPKLYAPLELIDMPMTLFINIRGMAAKLGSPMGKGVVWGHEFLLEHDEVWDTIVASALTFVEVLTLTKGQIEERVEEYDDEFLVIQSARRFYRLKNKLKAWGRTIITERDTLATTTMKLAFGSQKRRVTQLNSAYGEREFTEQVSLRSDMRRGSRGKAEKRAPGIGDSDTQAYYFSAPAITTFV